MSRLSKRKTVWKMATARRANRFAKVLKGSRKKTSGAQRACSACGKLGHNKRSHKRGGKLYRKKA